MTNVTITVRTINGGNVEVEESNSRRTYGQSDVEFVAELLDKAAAKIRAAYNLPGSKDVGRCIATAPPISGPDPDGYPSARCSLNHGHTGAHHDDEMDADWWRDPNFGTRPTAPQDHEETRA